MIPKFKAWDKYDEMMVSIISFDFENKVAYVEQENGDRYDIHFDNLIFLQSTGLKDKNGVEIYEGDIVILTSKSINYADTYWHKYAEVFQHPNGAYRLRGKGIYETELYSNRKQVTLTGNIYETPELLENDRFCTETDDPDY
ncbi:YopX family protein [Enterococcus avium]